MIFDIAVLSVLFVSCLIAFLRGFIRETLTIVGVVGGAAAALGAGPLLVPPVRGWFGITPDMKDVPKLMDIVPMTIVADICAYGAIFVVVVIILSVVSHLLSGWAKALGLGALDRTFGVLFGIARALVILGLLYLPAYLYYKKEEREEWAWLKDSKTLVYVEGVSAWIEPYLPESTKDDIKKTAENATREKLQELDILRSKDKDEDKAEPSAAETAPALPAPSEGSITGPGYEDRQREDLKNLIENESGQND